MPFTAQAPYMLWIFWFGPMGPVRQKSIDTIKRTAGVSVIVLGDLNYTTVGDLHPLALSPALSKVHLSDYLRAFVMQKFGGAYQDVKPTTIDWKSKIAHLNSHDNLWFFGADELPWHKSHPAWDKQFGTTGLLPSYSIVKKLGPACVTSNGYYAAKPNTALTKRWLDLVTQKMAIYLQSVQLHPAPRPRCCTKYKENGYPIYWSELHGDILQPLQVVHCRRIARFESIVMTKKYKDD